MSLLCKRADTVHEDPKEQKDGVRHLLWDRLVYYVPEARELRWSGKDTAEQKSEGEHEIGNVTSSFGGGYSGNDLIRDSVSSVQRKCIDGNVVAYHMREG